MNAIEATGLRKRFGTTQALDGVDLAAEAGTVLGVLGPNGAGKTTAVRVLATLLRPDAGSARIGGHDVLREPHRVRASIGLTGQYASVDEDLTGTQNLRMIGELLDLSGAQSRARARELLAWFDLSEAAGTMAKHYSGGMRRRLDLAASLVGRPAVIFLDEPTTGLDPAKREEMWEVIRTLVTEGSTVLLTTQYLEEADALADAITVIDHGRVIAHDTPDGLKRVVGGSRIAVRPTDPDRLPEVAAILSDLSGAVPETTGRHRLTVPVAGEEALPLAVARLAGAGIALTELSLHLPSLDEVFLTLTGRPAHDEPGVGDSHPNDPAAGSGPAEKEVAA
jgi:oleandomycin transport system ATP-binding protein